MSGRKAILEKFFDFMIIQLIYILILHLDGSQTIEADRTMLRKALAAFSKTPTVQFVLSTLRGESINPVRIGIESKIREVFEAYGLGADDYFDLVLQSPSRSNHWRPTPTSFRITTISVYPSAPSPIALVRLNTTVTAFFQFGNPYLLFSAVAVTILILLVCIIRTFKDKSQACMTNTSYFSQGNSPAPDAAIREDLISQIARLGEKYDNLAAQMAQFGEKYDFALATISTQNTTISNLTARFQAAGATSSASGTAESPPAASSTPPSSPKSKLTSPLPCPGVEPASPPPSSSIGPETAPPSTELKPTNVSAPADNTCESAPFNPKTKPKSSPEPATGVPASSGAAPPSTPIIAAPFTPFIPPQTSKCPSRQQQLRDLPMGLMHGSPSSTPDSQPQRPQPPFIQPQPPRQQSSRQNRGHHPPQQSTQLKEYYKRFTERLAKQERERTEAAAWTAADNQQ